MEIDDESENDDDGYAVDSLSHVAKENAISRNENNSCGKPSELYGCVGDNFSHVANQSATLR